MDTKLYVVEFGYSVNVVSDKHHIEADNFVQAAKIAQDYIDEQNMSEPEAGESSVVSLKLLESRPLLTKQAKQKKPRKADQKSAGKK